MTPSASVVIPAHNEERTIGRLLSALTNDGSSSALEIVVVCNGCTDKTSSVARGYGHSVRVVEIERPSKHWALVAGDGATDVFPRFYVDADVEIGSSALGDLTAALKEPGTLAVAPERDLVLAHSQWLVRSYYRVWRQLPAVRDGLFGRGVVGMHADGHRRIATRPEVLGDDLYVHARFSPSERRIVQTAHVRIWAPRRVSDLIRRRTRAVEGNAELVGRDDAVDTSSSSGRAVLRILAERRTSAVDVVVFLTVTSAARLSSRVRSWRGTGGWLRDESSRE